MLQRATCPTSLKQYNSSSIADSYLSTMQDFGVQSVSSTQQILDQIAGDAGNLGKGLGVILENVAQKIIPQALKEKKHSKDEKAVSEPVKSYLLDYYNYLLPSSEYMIEVSEKITQAKTHLEAKLQSKKSHERFAAVFDVDDTAVSHASNFIAEDFQNTPLQIDERLRKINNPAIAPVLGLYKELQTYNVECFFISYRIAHESNPDKNLLPATFQNLNNVGYNVSEKNIYLPDKENLALRSIDFKTKIRKSITESGYTIILNIGDQPSDLGEHAELNLLLPNKLYGPSSLLGLNAIVQPTLQQNKDQEQIVPSPFIREDSSSINKSKPLT